MSMCAAGILGTRPRRCPGRQTGAREGAGAGRQADDITRPSSVRSRSSRGRAWQPYRVRREPFSTGCKAAISCGRSERRRRVGSGHPGSLRLPEVTRNRSHHWTTERPPRAHVGRSARQLLFSKADTVLATFSWWPWMENGHTLRPFWRLRCAKCGRRP